MRAPHSLSNYLPNAPSPNIIILGISILEKNKHFPSDPLSPDVCFPSSTGSEKEDPPPSRLWLFSIPM